VRLVAEKKVNGYHVVIPEDSEGKVLTTDIQLLDDAGEQMPALVMYRVLQAQADLLLTAQMYEEDAFDSQEVALAQMRDIKRRTPELA
jgi:hypothetical protein